MKTRWHTPKLLSKKATAELLHDPLWVKEDALTQRLKGKQTMEVITVYMHRDGRLLYLDNFSDRARIFASKADLEPLLLSLEATQEAMLKGSKHMLSGTLLYEHEFVSYVSPLIDGLAEQLNLSRQALDASIESVKIIEVKVKRLGRKKSLEPAFFSGLVAYIGEVIRIAVGGHWKMELSRQDGETWEPWIVDSEGRYYNSWYQLYRMLADVDAIAIYGSTLSEINHRGLLPPPSSFKPPPQIE